MGASTALRLADLVEESLGLEPGSADAEPRVVPADPAELRDVPAGLAALLVELARVPAEPVDVAQGWSPGLRPGDEVGRFVLRREIGRGGIGVVYEALDRDLDEPVAFKALRPGRPIPAHGAAWLRREAEVLARLDHPNVVALDDFGRGPSGPYLVSELLRGETLADRLLRGPLELREAVAVATVVARVLAHAHGEGAVHRDLKPANVFLCEDGAVKVLDFGLAWLFGRAGPVAGGTPAYVAPEQGRGEPGDGRSDLFALGVLVHHMITGRLPWLVSRGGEAPRAPRPPPRLIPYGLPPDLRKLAASLVRRDPAARPGSAREVVDALALIRQRLAAF